VKLSEKNRNFSGICLENRNFVDSDPRPPRFQTRLTPLVCHVNFFRWGRQSLLQYWMGAMAGFAPPWIRHCLQFIPTNQDSNLSPRRMFPGLDLQLRSTKTISRII